MNSSYLLLLAFLVLSRRSFASFPIGGLEGPVAAVPVHAPIAAPIVHSPLPAPIAFQNGPIFTSLTPSIDPVHHTPTIEVHNVIRTAGKETGHFSGTMHRSSGSPIKS